MAGRGDNCCFVAAGKLTNPKFALDRPTVIHAIHVKPRIEIYKVGFRLVLLVFTLSLVSLTLQAATGGSISGTVADPIGAVIPGAALRLVNAAQQTTYQAVSDTSGFYSFPTLPVGHYD